ncbi:probable 1-acyl-sn-glycerol-3-phosphate acyltransferase 5 isoform X2 [Cucurbita pepo subsp. pepo]|uniref:probable 1-acyl-sn-glycerol-3-phosphate acyltransferase 5 isoform X2 n=1 Tax=Cucurbita pepo subsp. pepo TaxID=3664 RepID=UPI000C9D2D2F|nr:probable 1-acyl-sn-glycerol-3-phosphate acyltransferase 5 isoform X2 [Cucurbita pepo subsp. pepo]
MEVKDVEMRDRTLTPARLFRGLLCLLVLLLTAFMMLVFYGFISAIFVRVFSIHYSRKATSFFFGSWLAVWPFLFEKINKTKVIFSGEMVPARERVLIIANHRTEVDWMYLWDLAIRKGQLGYIKYILKSSLMKLPVFGWGFHILEFISVERKWEVDESTMRQMLSTFKDYHDPLWLALFPEGTDFTEQKCIRSQKYAAENGLPILKNLLLPKTKGFHTCVQDLRKCLDAENEVANWLMDTFSNKDQLLDKFHSQGHFPHEGTEGDLSTMKCLVSITTLMVLTSLSTYLTFFSSIWFKIYVLFACSYLAFATRFNIRPMPIFHRKKSY